MMVKATTPQQDRKTWGRATRWNMAQPNSACSPDSTISDGARARSASRPPTGFVNLFGGTGIGLMADLAFIGLHKDAALPAREPIGAAMLLWRFAASFGMGAIGTALWLLPYG